MSMFMSACRENNILCTPDACFDYLHELPEKYEQMSIFDLEQEGDNYDGQRSDAQPNITKILYF